MNKYFTFLIVVCVLFFSCSGSGGGGDDDGGEEFHLYENLQFSVYQYEYAVRADITITDKTSNETFNLVIQMLGVGIHTEIEPAGNIEIIKDHNIDVSVDLLFNPNGTPQSHHYQTVSLTVDYPYTFHFDFEKALNGEDFLSFGKLGIDL